MKTLLGTNFQSTEKLNGKRILNFFWKYSGHFSMHAGQLDWVCRQSTVDCLNNVRSTDYKIEFGLGLTKMDTVTSLLVIYSKIKYTQFW